MTADSLREMRVDEGVDNKCRYHSERPARWYCEPCDLGLCKQCKPYAERVPADVHCPLCQEIMTDTDIGELFWRNPKPHLKYPLERNILIFIGLLTLPGILLPVGLAMALLGVPLIVLAAWYAFQAFFTSSRGESEPPDIRQLISLEHFPIFKRFIAVSAAYGLVTIAAFLIGSVLLAIPALLLVAAIYPASLMVMAADEKARAAFEAERVYQVINRLDMAYLILAGLVFVLLAAPGTLLYSVPWDMPGWLYRGLLIPVQAYAVFLVMRYIGYALFQYQRQLEYAGGIPVIDRDRRLKPEEYEPPIALTDARIQTGEGRIDDARWTVGNALTRYPDHPELNKHFEQLLISTDDDKALRNHLDRRLHKLAVERKADMAVDAWLRNRQYLKNWMPRSSKARHRMGQELARREQYRTALKFLLSLPKNDRRYGLLPEACMLSAKILEHAMDDIKGAEELRRFVRQNHPDRADDWERHGHPGDPEFG